MYFESFSDFLQMGKHGAFVWSAYGCFVLVLVVNIFNVVTARKKAIKEVRAVQDLNKAESQNK